MLDEIVEKDQPSDKSPDGTTLREPPSAVKPARNRKSFVRRMLTGCVRMVAGLAAAAMLAFVLLVWRLSEGPVSVAFVAPHISSAISKAVPGLDASFRDTVLVWGGWTRGIDVRVIDLRIIAEDNEVLGFIPEMAFSLSATALAHMEIAVAEIELFEPALFVRRSPSGRFEFGFVGDGKPSDVLASTLLARLSDKRANNPAAFLNRLTIKDADLVIEDQVAGRTWATPGANIAVRRAVSGFVLDAAFSAELDGKTATFDVSGSVASDTGDIEASVSFEAVNPAVFAGMFDAGVFLSRVSVLMDGTLFVTGDLNGRIDTIAFDLVGTGGRVSLPMPFNAALATDSVRITGRFDAVINRLDLEAFDVAFSPGTTVEAPGTRGHIYVVRQLQFAGAYQGGENRLAIDRLTVEIDDLEVSLSGLVDNIIDSPSLMLDVSVSGIDLARLSTYWPATIGVGARNWIKARIPEGRLNGLSVMLEGGVADDGRFEIEKLNGSFGFQDFVVHYIHSMLPVTHAHGTGYFDHDQVRFDIVDAQSHDMAISQASVTISGISGLNKQARIRVPLKGTFRHAMELIDRDPLRYASALGIDPLSVTGNVDVLLAFDFPVLPGLVWDDITMSATARVRGAGIPDGLFDLDIRDGSFDITFSNDGLDMIGDLKLEGYATNINWHRAFDAQARARNVYTLNVWVDYIESLPVPDVLRIAPFAGDVVRGDVPLWLNVIEYPNGEAVLTARADLTGTVMSIPALEWAKPSGVAGEARAELILRDGNIREISSFRLKAPEFSVEGRADYASQTPGLSRIDLLSVAVGRTRLEGLLIPRENGFWEADFSGESLNLAGLWDALFTGDLTSTGDSSWPDVALSARFDRVWLSGAEHIDNFNGAFVRKEKSWRTVFMTATLEDNESIGIKLAPSPENETDRLLTMRSKDAGAVFRLLRISDNLVGGDFLLQGTLENAESGSSLFGRMEVDDFRVLNTPALTRIVSVMSLTGILESLSGEGLYFTQLTMPFRYDDGVFEVTKVRASGPSLGFTADGNIYVHADVIDIQGTVVPVYMLNSMLGNIPLIGNLFSGGEEGGGVFAARYSMTGPREAPEVTVNPLSALAPGFLRNVFGLLEGVGDAGPPPG